MFLQYFDNYLYKNIMLSFSFLIKKIIEKKYKGAWEK